MTAPRLRPSVGARRRGASLASLIVLVLLVGGPASSSLGSTPTAWSTPATLAAPGPAGVTHPVTTPLGGDGQSRVDGERTAIAAPAVDNTPTTGSPRTTGPGGPGTATPTDRGAAPTLPTATLRRASAGVTSRPTAAAPSTPSTSSSTSDAAVLPISDPKPVSRSALVPSTGDNPLAGATLYTDPRTWAGYVAGSAGGVTAAAAGRLAAVPQAHWVTPSDSPTSVGDLVGAAAAVGQLPVLVLYGIPGRDCSGYSAGGFATAAQYLVWVAGIRQAIAGRPVVLILEPDALASGGCTPLDLPTRLLTLAGAVDLLTLDPGTAVYIDAGHQEWLSPQEAATRLQLAHVGRARGFSLNVSNFYATADEVAYGDQVSALLGGSHFVVDTSRNGAGPAPAAPENWCNPAGRLLGHLPTAAAGDPDGAGDPAFDGDLWVKHPGESDGACSRGEPTSGTWFALWANDIVARSTQAGVFG